MENEILFYGGVLLCACSVVLAIILGSWYQVRKTRLNSRLDEEYGKKKNRKQ